jgi:hypothetical protein
VRRRLVVGIVLGLIAATAQARDSGDLRPGLIKPGGLPVFFSSEGPLAYSSLTRDDLSPDAVPIGPVFGRSCQFSLAVPISASFRATSISGAVGNGTYGKILKQMERDHPGLQGIYDVKVDLQYISILGIFGKLCTEINAQGYR